ncbi:MAG: hypothetical protein LBH61_06840 [Dysgonamonadaceae bacterium]|jgi:hypothetical protein|nr:hypothetical protein [Dysgonamonadaceae bacterium]
MNTKIKLFFILIAGVCIGMVSCDKDNDNGKDKTDYAKEIAGKYTGDISTPEGVRIATDAVIDIEKVSGKKVLLKMDQNIYGLPVNIKCESTVTYGKEEYHIAGSTSFNAEIKEPVAVSVPISVVVSGTINGEGVANLDIKLSANNSPVPLPDVVFTGTKE